MNVVVRRSDRNESLVNFEYSLKQHAYFRDKFLTIHIYICHLKWNSCDISDISKIYFLKYLALRAWIEVNITQKYFPP